MKKTRDIKPVNSAKVRHREAAVFTRQVRMIINSSFYRSPEPLNNWNLSFFRNYKSFPHVPYDFVEKKNNRSPVSFGHVECIDCYGEYILVIRCCKSDYGMISMCSPPCLVYVTLAH